MGKRKSWLQKAKYKTRIKPITLLAHVSCFPVALVGPQTQFPPLITFFTTLVNLQHYLSWENVPALLERRNLWTHENEIWSLPDSTEREKQTLSSSHVISLNDAHEPRWCFSRWMSLPPGLIISVSPPGPTWCKREPTPIPQAVPWPSHMLMCLYSHKTNKM